jgi:hypothetical protein
MKTTIEVNNAILSAVISKGKVGLIDTEDARHAFAYVKSCLTNEQYAILQQDYQIMIYPVGLVVGDDITKVAD